EVIYRERNWVALLGVFVFTAAFMLGMALRPALQETHSEAPVMHVSLATPVEPPPIPQPVQTPTPQPRSPTPTPTTAAAPTQPAAPSTPQAPSAPATPQAPVVAPAAAPNAAQIEAAYASVVRQRIEQEKVYPTSREARIQHPE